MLNKNLKDLKAELNIKRHNKINKILESDKIDSIINKVQDLYHKISDKLIIKYNLQDELKQGKIYTILFAIIAFILLIILTIFFAFTLNSILGIGLIFSFLRQISFCTRLGYAIIKSKGKMIKKYLSNLFPNSQVLQEKKEINTIPLYEESVLYEIQNFIEELNNSNLDLDVLKEISIKLRDIVDMLNFNKLDFKDEIHNFEYKKNIAYRLSDVYKLYQDNLENKKRQDEFLNLKDDVLEQINEVNNKVYIKKRT